MFLCIGGAMGCMVKGEGVLSVNYCSLNRFALDGASCPLVLTQGRRRQSWSPRHFIRSSHYNIRMELTQSAEIASPGKDPSQARCVPHSATQMSAKDYDARAAIALNNIGVSLLERGAYQLALQTFKDSVALLHRTIGVNPTTNSNDGIVRHMLHLAETRLASSFGPTIDSIPQSDMRIRRVLYDGSAFCNLKFDLAHTLTKTMYVPVSMEPSECSREDSMPGTSFRSAVFLYNFALAHLCLAQVVPSPSSNVSGITFSQHLLFTARQLLGMVLQLLATSIETTAWSMWTEGSRLALTCLSLAYLGATMPGMSRFHTAPPSNELSLAVESWRYWIYRTGHWIDDETAVVLVEPTSEVNQSNHSLQMRVLPHVKKAPAA
jgi:hypothetical protein